MKRYGILVASIIIQSSLGGIYAWSVFVPDLHAVHGLPMGEAQIPFGVCIATFTVIMVLAGRLQERVGPCVTAFVGGFLFGTGFLVASLSQGRLLPLLIGVGFIAGAGIGCCYVSALATCIGWFPERRGLVTGLAVVGFGGGAVILSNGANVALEANMDVLTVFRWIGILYGTGIMGAALVLRTPPLHEHRGSVQPVAITHLVRNGPFWRLVAGMGAGTFAGLMVVSNIKPLGQTGELSEHITTGAISAFAVGNAAGRILWGVLSDRFEGRTIPASLFFLSGSSLLLIPTAQLPYGFIMAACLAGLGFGACFVLYVAEVARRFGPNAVGRIYPIIFLAYGLLGTTGPPVAGAIFDRTGSYAIPLYIAAGLTLAIGLASINIGKLTPSSRTITT